MNKLAAGLFLIVACVFIALGKGGGAGLETVRVREGHLKEKPQHFSRVIITADYADRVEVLESPGPFWRVRHLKSEQTGWLHKSALTPRHIVLESTDRRTIKGIRKGDTTLAGRGFRGEVEQEYRLASSELEAGFAWLDDHVEVDPAFNLRAIDIAQFLADGELKPLEDGQP